MSFLPFIPTILESMSVHDPARLALWSGLIFGAAPLAATFSGPFWGGLGDRFGRRLMVVRAMVGIAVFVGAMYFATSPLQLLLLRIGQGTLSGFIAPSITLVTLVAPVQHQGRVTADLQTSLALGSILGPALGGWVVAAGIHPYLFPGVSGLALISALLVLLGAREQKSGRVAHRPVIAQLRQDLLETGRRPPIQAVIVLLLFLQLGLAGTNPLMELHLRDLETPEHLTALLGWLPGGPVESTEVNALATSLLFTGMAACHLLFLPLWGRLGDAIGYRRALLLAGVGALVSLVVQAAAGQFLPLFLGRMLMGASLAGAGPLCFAVVVRCVPDDQRGSAIGLVTSARMFAVAAGGMVGGAVSSRIGIPAFMALSAGAVLLSLPIFWWGASRGPGVGARDQEFETANRSG